MLENCFQLILGIGEITEKKLWEAGIKSWNDVLQKSRPPQISSSVWNKLTRDINKYQGFISKNDYMGLKRNLPDKLTWRAIPNYQGKIAYLDIETTGLSYNYHQITTIAVYDGIDVYTFVNGKNLNDFEEFITNYPAIATFYGKGFDVPFIRNFLGCEMNQIHFDVCFLLRRIGFSGGLKSIERQLNFSRGIMSELGGIHAVVLWKRYKATGDERYLETLLAYNVEDVLNLEFLVNFAYNGIVTKENLPLPSLPCELRDSINPYKPNRDIVREVKYLNPHW